VSATSAQKGIAVKKNRNGFNLCKVRNAPGTRGIGNEGGMLMTRDGLGRREIRNGFALFKVLSEVLILPGKKAREWPAKKKSNAPHPLSRRVSALHWLQQVS
jgi:hypothetical protein